MVNVSAEAEIYCFNPETYKIETWNGYDTCPGKRTIVKNSLVQKKKEIEQRKFFNGEVFTNKLNNFERSVKEIINKKEEFQFKKKNPDNFSKNQCNSLKKSIYINVNKLSREFKYFESLEIPNNLIQLAFKINGLEKYLDDLNNDLSCDDIKIAKAEPSQTQKVTGKEPIKTLDKNIYVYDKSSNAINLFSTKCYSEWGLKKKHDCTNYDGPVERAIALRFASAHCKSYNKSTIGIPKTTIKVTHFNKPGFSRSYKCINFSNETQIAKAEPTVKPKKTVEVAKVVEPPREIIPDSDYEKFLYSFEKREFANYVLPNKLNKKFKNCKTNTCRKDKSGKFVYKAFIKNSEKKKLENPGDIIHGMAMYEILFLTKVNMSKKYIARFVKKNPYYDFNKKLDPVAKIFNNSKKMNSLIKMNNTREKLRKSLGMDLTVDINTALSRYWVLGDVLNLGDVKVTKTKLHPDVKKRKKLLKKYQETLAKFNKKLKENENL